MPIYNYLVQLIPIIENYSLLKTMFVICEYIHTFGFKVSHKTEQHCNIKIDTVLFPIRKAYIIDIMDSPDAR